MKFQWKFLCIIISLTVLKFSLEKKSSDLGVINLSNYNYPHPEPPSNTEDYSIAIFATSDYHGYSYPREFVHPITKEKYYNGSIATMASLIDSVRDEWKDRMLWLDSGDQASGGYEYIVSKGQIMTDFFNAKGLTASTIGNHDFDFGLDFMYHQMKQAKFDYLVANIQNKTTGEKEFMPNQIRYKIYNVGKIKLGVIGLTHNKLGVESVRVKEIKFLEYYDVIVELSKKLRSEGANAIILLAHFGLLCDNKKGYPPLSSLRVRKESDPQAGCQELDGVIELLNKLDKSVVNAVIAGHAHRVTHNWINHIPLVSSSGGSYANVVYLHFKKSKLSKSQNYVFNSVEIEGPIPVCTKVYSKAMHCKHYSNLSKKYSKDPGDLVKVSFHNKIIEDDKEVQKILNKYDDLMKPFREPICYNEVYLMRNKQGENNLQNLVTDGIRRATGTDITLINVDGFRSKWLPGEINKIELYNMFPFDNMICSFEMKGWEVKKMMYDISGRFFYSTSGVRVTYDRKTKKCVHVGIYVNGELKEIEDDKTYSISSFDYLLAGNIEFKKVMSWYKVRNMECKETVKGIVENYLRSLGYIKVNDFVDPLHPRIVLVDN